MDEESLLVPKTHRLMERKTDLERVVRQAAELRGRVARCQDLMAAREEENLARVEVLEAEARRIQARKAEELQNISDEIKR